MEIHGDGKCNQLPSIQLNLTRSLLPPLTSGAIRIRLCSRGKENEEPPGRQIKHACGRKRQSHRRKSLILLIESHLQEDVSYLLSLHVCNVCRHSASVGKCLLASADICACWKSSLNVCFVQMTFRHQIEILLNSNHNWFFRPIQQQFLIVSKKRVSMSENVLLCLRKSALVSKHLLASANIYKTHEMSVFVKHVFFCLTWEPPGRQTKHACGRKRQSHCRKSLILLVESHLQEYVSHLLSLNVWNVCKHSAYVGKRLLASADMCACRKSSLNACCVWMTFRH